MQRYYIWGVSKLFGDEMNSKSLMYQEITSLNRSYVFCFPGKPPPMSRRVMLKPNLRAMLNVSLLCFNADIYADRFFISHPT